MKLTKQSLLFGSLFASSLFSVNCFAHDLVLTIDNIEKTKGVMMIALYNSEATYKSNQNTFGGKKVTVTDKTMTVHFDVPSGDYAIKLFQDENENGSIDKNLIGIPKEGYGFSNNGGAMGQPSYSEAKFAVDSTTNITIHLR
ncbi:hypothetical protein GCM10011613_07750 [Cellvibrio zantedeschiae]|uniref:DUF2141 domain-containing protein n=2 Tax=Cellvibrio zantedeschiae TaxID=1237077 RepID=A0ABQ3ATH2_9GAMM|nr:hypothetical protein GCM10011613_07750 [Cellvibrio zantedeschiae]